MPFRLFPLPSAALAPCRGAVTGTVPDFASSHQPGKQREFLQGSPCKRGLTFLFSKTLSNIFSPLPFSSLYVTCFRIPEPPINISKRMEPTSQPKVCPQVSSTQLYSTICKTTWQNKRMGGFIRETRRAGTRRKRSKG